MAYVAPIRLFAALACSIVLAACGSDGDKSKSATQVAVKVNSSEISVHQVNYQLARVNAKGMTPEQQAAAKKRVVDGIVDQQLFLDEAIRAKLDRDPEILARLDAARRDILAQAYIQKTHAPASRPTAEDVKKYYQDNPALFAQRKAYRIQELLVELPVDRLDELRSQVTKAKSMSDLAAWLKSSGVRFVANSGARTAEQIPLSMLPRIAAMKDGEMAVFSDERGIAVIQVVETQPQPIGEADAAPAIEQYLTNSKLDKLVQADLKRLRDASKIEYKGDFGAAEKAPAPSKNDPAEASKGAAQKSAVDKGVGGLR